MTGLNSVENPKSLHSSLKEGRDWWNRKISNCVGTTHPREENMANIREDKRKGTA